MSKEWTIGKDGRRVYRIPAKEFSFAPETGKRRWMFGLFSKVGVDLGRPFEWFDDGFDMCVVQGNLGGFEYDVD